MLVAQLTDLHLRPGENEEPGSNRERFRASIDTLQAMARRPDLYLVTGDITDGGDEGSYRFFLQTMRSLGRPWLSLLGNHDRADRFAHALAQEPADERRHSGSVRVADWRIVAVDTAMAGMDGGWFDERRGEALAAALAADEGAPTIVAMHHPPVASGVEWIDPDTDAGWIERFGEVVSRFAQVRQIVCGHAHMAVATRFRDIPLCIVPAISAQLWPEFAPFDANGPDGRIMVVDGQPGFALHRLGEGTVATTFATPAAGQVRLRHEPEVSRLVAHN